MAKRKSERQPAKVAEEDPEAKATDDLPAAEERDELALRAKDGEGDSDEEGAGEEGSDEAGSGAIEAAKVADTELATEDVAAAQLGTERYVMAGFFAAGMLCAYVLGKFVHGVWAYASNKDWLSQTLPRVAAVADDDKTTYSFIIGGIAAMILVLRTYRKPDVRSWSDEVASELTKVKWPTKKEVSNSTMVVIAASAVATIYLALLDRLWGFITNLVYGDGS
jgi:preprotein translocase subunit SecE